MRMSRGLKAAFSKPILTNLNELKDLLYDIASFGFE